MKEILKENYQKWFHEAYLDLERYELSGFDLG